MKWTSIPPGSLLGCCEVEMICCEGEGDEVL